MQSSCTVPPYRTVRYRYQFRTVLLYSITVLILYRMSVPERTVLIRTVQDYRTIPYMCTGMVRYRPVPVLIIPNRSTGTVPYGTVLYSMDLYGCTGTVPYRTIRITFCLSAEVQRNLYGTVPYRNGTVQVPVPYLITILGVRTVRYVYRTVRYRAVR